jgi:H+/Cl- antiporter ClcA
MSRKHKRQKKKKIPWYLLALGGILVIIAVFLFARQDGDGGGTPSIVVDQQKIDYGDVKLGVNKTFAIKVTNTGGGTLRFKEEPYIEVLEGC